MAVGRGTQVRRGALVLVTVAVVVWAARRLSAAGASWSAAWRSIFDLPWAWFAVLAAVWLAGQVVYTVALAASMPGLSRRRALTLSLSGSAVTNLLPFGAIAGAAVSLAMVRAWGHDTLGFVRYVVVSRTCDLVTKLGLPVVVVAALLLDGAITAGSAAVWFAGAAATAAVGGLVVAALAGRATPLLRLVRRAERLWTSARRGDPATRWTTATASMLDGTGRLVRRRWPELAAGTGGYWLLQGVLLGLCLVAVGASTSAPVVLAGLLVERTMTLLAFTPGGAGIVEVGTTGALIALGVDPTSALAGVLLFRGFVFVAEIPVGGATLAGWFVARRLSARSRAGDPPAAG